MKGKQIIIRPENGWEERTYYVVEVCYNTDNPIHQDIFYSGFLISGEPNAYNILMNSQESIDKVMYLKVIRKINKNIDNNYRTLRDIYPEYFI